MSRLFRGLCYFLALIMILGLFPLATLAEDTQNLHTVRFQLNYNGAPKLDIQKVVHGDCATQPDGVYREGWIFQYWYRKTDNGNEKFDLSQPITEDVALYAKWKQDVAYWAPVWDSQLRGIQGGDGETFTITFAANGADVEGLPQAQKISSGSYVIEPTQPTRAVYTFTGWYTDADCTKPFSFDTQIKKDMTLYAGWECTIYAKPVEEEHIAEGTLTCEGNEYTGEYIDNELIISIYPTYTKEDLETLILQNNGTIVGQIPSIGYYQIEFDSCMTTTSLTNLSQQLAHDPIVESADLHYVNTYVLNRAIQDNKIFDYSFFDSDNHSAYNRYTEKKSFWWLDVTNVYEARKLLGENNSHVNVGIVDGVVTFHDDLSALQENVHLSKRISITADKIDYNTTDSSKYMHYAHGTHVAGIIGADNNGIGISGVCDNVSLYSVQMHKEGTSSYYAETTFHIGTFEDITAFAYLIEKDCKIINYSMGFTEGTKSEKAIKSANVLTEALSKYIVQGKKFLIVTSAGNNAIDAQYNNAFTYINSLKNLPFSSITGFTTHPLCDHIIVVSSIKLCTKESSKIFYNAHNYGSCVDLLAPGQSIISTVPKTNENGFVKTGYLTADGTSVASPIVAGIAALVWQADPTLSSKEVK